MAEPMMARRSALSFKRRSLTPLRLLQWRTCGAARSMAMLRTTRSMPSSQWWPIVCVCLEIGAKAPAASRKLTNHFSHSIAQR